MSIEYERVIKNLKLSSITLETKDFKMIRKDLRVSHVSDKLKYYIQL